MKKTDTKKITVIGMFCALAFVAMVSIKIPVVTYFIPYKRFDSMLNIQIASAAMLAVSLPSLYKIIRA